MPLAFSRTENILDKKPAQGIDTVDFFFLRDFWVHTHFYFDVFSLSSLDWLILVDLGNPYFSQSAELKGYFPLRPRCSFEGGSVQVLARFGVDVDSETSTSASRSILLVPTQGCHLQCSLRLLTFLDTSLAINKGVMHVLL